MRSFVTYLIKKTTQKSVSHIKKKSLAFLKQEIGKYMNLEKRAFKVLICMCNLLGLLLKFLIPRNIIAVFIKMRHQNSYN